MIPPLQLDDATRSIGHRLVVVAGAAPAAPAFSNAEGSISYGKLLERACECWAQITALIGTDCRQRVAVLCKTGADQHASLLGVLLAGHVAVSIDWTAPAAYCASLIADCEPGLLIHDAANVALAAQICEPGRLPQLNLASISPVSTQPHSVSCVPCAPEDPAWIVYTSGSTGHPKGVVWSHQACIHGVWRDAEAGRINASSHIGTLVSFTTGAGVRGLLQAYLSGAHLCHYEFSTRGLVGLAQWIKDTGITIVKIPVAIARELATAKRVEPVYAPALGAVSLGGAHRTMVDYIAVHRLLPGAWRCDFGYAATEAAPVCWKSLSLDQPDDDAPSSGPPLSGIKIRIVGSDGQELPIGQQGEIVVCSKYISSGYWRQPELTRKSFDFLDTGITEFRTGDIGFLDDPGEVHVIGRSDDAIKIRGHRVVPGDVEAVVRQHQQVRDVVVFSKLNAGREPELIAAVVADKDTRLSPEQIRQWISSRRPAAMIPKWVWIGSALPLLRNGKPDRAAIATQLQQIDPKNNPETPDDALLATVWRAWQDVLRIPIASSETRFLDAGGDSFAAVQLEARLSTLLNRPVALADLLKYPTISAQAYWLAHGDVAEAIAGSTAQSAHVVNLNDGAVGTRVYVMPTVTGGVDYARHIAKRMSTRPVFGVLPPIQPDGSPVATSLQELSDQIAAAIAVHNDKRTFVILGACVAGRLGVVVADACVKRGESPVLALITDAPPPRSEQLTRRITVRGSLVWTRHACASLVKEARKHGLLRPMTLVAGTTRTISKRVTQPLSKRRTIRMQAYAAKLRALSRAHDFAPTHQKTHLICGAWSQMGLQFAQYGASLGWSKWLPSLDVSYVPGTHSDIFNPPFAQSLADEISDVIERCK